MTCISCSRPSLHGMEKLNYRGLVCHVQGHVMMCSPVGGSCGKGNSSLSPRLGQRCTVPDTVYLDPDGGIRFLHQKSVCSGIMRTCVHSRCKRLLVTCMSTEPESKLLLQQSIHPLNQPCCCCRVAWQVGMPVDIQGLHPLLHFMTGKVRALVTAVISGDTVDHIQLLQSSYGGFLGGTTAGI